MNSLDSARKLDEERTAGEWWFEDHCIVAPVFKMLGTVEDCDDRAFIAASTSREFGWRATAEALARAEARIAELERAGDALTEVVANAGTGKTHSADCGAWHDNCRKLDAWTAAKEGKSG